MRLVSLVTGLFLAFGSLASAQAYDTPQALLEAFYEPYFSDNFYDDESVFRSAALNALYDADANSTPEGEMGALDFDPYVDGQDYMLSDLVIGTPEISGDTAVVEVDFKNFDQPMTIYYDLVKEDGGWKIDDVYRTDGEYPYRLSEIFLSAQPAQ
ncbi:MULTISPECIES: DUF3828 domain-containing protein [Devosia]|uniref:DUF3828 domain-containing protein n=1 Tax=Devosia equisanguinis TaxID=2490941 RepID=A0A447I8L4_9HYPH|nr:MULTISPECIES: DUF3828 domain-containing protein [Devosia]ODT50640.1 MAG: hypothetical protein ABS74_03795 [Pelagibacterium sp. SCN 63-126]ODU85241.1 MAG: hypothetical protein ABT14_13415 [Pelagibacterium sp. SCN 63-17]OJX45412.1 MAG: hypothetical protein BGO80_06255 [Devosia sp. 63-57]VDS03866.1 hypothetical protein DEVEQU_00995 [Devosia equisanguinis]